MKSLIGDNQEVPLDRRINILQKGQESNCLHNKMPNMKDLC